MKHYEKSELDMYLHKKMSAPARIACTRHLVNCQKCTELLVELDADNQFVEQLRVSINTLEQAARAANSQNNNGKDNNFEK